MTDSQTVKVKLSDHADALTYAKDLEARGFNVNLSPVLEGSNWFFNVEAEKPRPAEMTYSYFDPKPYDPSKGRFWCGW